jgi:excisionase family DNA binding protein
MKDSGGQRDSVDAQASTGEAELVDIEGVARRLGVTVRHVRRLVAERRVPFVKWGHLLRFDPEEIEAWIDEHRQVVPAEA